ncbi:MAG: hypothetical protein BRC29_03475 [Nanohaloarchaea archaeon SW_7_43_1]|nr:MAG: hypothetical protein BRC29_03475 [Nanohaloarchaea archaeon SW_7_43_1]
MKVAGYVRVSTEKQKEEGAHERQKEQLENWASRKDYDVEIFMDAGISGQKREREQYQEMMDSIEEFDAVVVRELSRMGRSLKNLIEDIEELGRKDTDFISLSENLDTTTAQGKLLFQIMGAFSEFYANKKREETLAMIERRKAEGKSIGRPKKLSQEDRRELYELWKDKDLSYRSLSKIFEDRVPDHYDDGLGASTVKRYIEEFQEEDN